MTSPDAPAPDVVEAVSAFPLPALLLEVPSARIFAASRTAQTLLDPDGPDIVGHSIEDFTADEPTGALELVGTGRLQGYEAQRILQRGTEQVPSTVWIRTIASPTPQRYALSLLIPESGVPLPALQRSGDDSPILALGSTDPHLTVDRISTDVTEMLGVTSLDIIGQSLLRIVDTPDVLDVMDALTHSARTGKGLSVLAGIVLPGSRSRICCLVVVPMLPAPSFGFALLIEEDEARPLASSAGMSNALWEFHETVRCAGTSRLLAQERVVPGLERLSAREMDIVTRLVHGDRVPAIATALFLSQSTVRNYLSAVFGKLGVNSQQGLIDLLRK
jgi:DNA-binding CsgD family transcriptional regulator